MNNAGGALQRAFQEMSWAENEAILRLNMVAPIELTHRLLPGMLQRQRGHIDNITSVTGRIGSPYTEVYPPPKMDRSASPAYCVATTAIVA